MRLGIVRGSSARSSESRTLHVESTTGGKSRDTNVINDAFPCIKTCVFRVKYFFRYQQWCNGVYKTLHDVLWLKISYVMLQIYRRTRNSSSVFKNWLIGLSSLKNVLERDYDFVSSISLISSNYDRQCDNHSAQVGICAIYCWQFTRYFVIHTCCVSSFIAERI